MRLFRSVPSAIALLSLECAFVATIHELILGRDRPVNVHGLNEHASQWVTLLLFETFIGTALSVMCTSVAVHGALQDPKFTGDPDGEEAFRARQARGAAVFRLAVISVALVYLPTALVVGLVVWRLNGFAGGSSAEFVVATPALASLPALLVAPREIKNPRMGIVLSWITVLAVVAVYVSLRLAVMARR